MKENHNLRRYLLVLAILAWFAIIAQYWINLSSGAAPLPELQIRFFSYFTITTNILVAVCSTVLLCWPRSKWGSFFARPKTLTAITVYIVVVGMIYNGILRFLWQPQGLQWIVDELLHSVIPLLFLVYWLLFARTEKPGWNAFWPWLVYPLAYVFFIFIRGSGSGFYPYPFIDVKELGLEKALVNAAGIALAFIIVSLFFIAIARRWNAPASNV